jgi:predicted transcriptional regulator
MQHRGEIIKVAVYESGFSITDIAKRLGRSRKWMYIMFENSNVSLDVVLEIGKIIHHDFSEDMPELKSQIRTTQQSTALPESYWKDKYLKLLEEYNELLKSKK